MGRGQVGTVDLWRPRWKCRGASALLLTGVAAAVALVLVVGPGQVRMVGRGGDVKTGRGLAGPGRLVEISESWSTCNCQQNAEARILCGTRGREQTRRYREGQVAGNAGGL